MKKQLTLIIVLAATLLMLSFGASAGELRDKGDAQTQLPPTNGQAMLNAIGEKAPAVGERGKADNQGTEQGFAATSAATNFTDIQNHWAKVNIEYVVNLGLFNGTSANRFEPNAKMTRAMFVTVLGRLYGVDPNAYGGSSFKDVATGKWYSPYIQWASDPEVGLVNGFGDGTFQPQANITREQMATLIYRYCSYAGLSMQIVSDFYYFNDELLINEYAFDGVTYCQITGLINGKNNNMFDPKGNSTRAEVATVLARLVKASQGQRIYLNYGDTGVPTYSSVVLQPCIGTIYPQGEIIEEYDLNGVGFYYTYNANDLAVYRSYLTQQGFNYISEEKEGDIIIHFYNKGNIVLGIAIYPAENVIMVVPDLNKIPV